MSQFQRRLRDDRPVRTIPSQGYETDTTTEESEFSAPIQRPRRSISSPHNRSGHTEQPTERSTVTTSGGIRHSAVDNAGYRSDHKEAIAAEYRQDKARKAARQGSIDDAARREVNATGKRLWKNSSGAYEQETDGQGRGIFDESESDPYQNEDGRWMVDKRDKYGSNSTEDADYGVKWSVGSDGRMVKKNKYNPYDYADPKDMLDDNDYGGMAKDALIKKTHAQEAYAISQEEYESKKHDNLTPKQRDDLERDMENGYDSKGDDIDQEAAQARLDEDDKHDALVKDHNERKKNNATLKFKGAEEWDRREKEKYDAQVSAMSSEDFSKHSAESLDGLKAKSAELKAYGEEAQLKFEARGLEIEREQENLAEMNARGFRGGDEQNKYDRNKAALQEKRNTLGREIQSFNSDYTKRVEANNEESEAYNNRVNSRNKSEVAKQVEARGERVDSIKQSGDDVYKEGQEDFKYDYIPSQEEKDISKASKALAEAYDWMPQLEINEANEALMATYSKLQEKHAETDKTHAAIFEIVSELNSQALLETKIHDRMQKDGMTYGDALLESVNLTLGLGFIGGNALSGFDQKSLDQIQALLPGDANEATVKAAITDSIRANMFDGNQDDEAHLLSDGRIVLNPALTFKDEQARAAIESQSTSPAYKKIAIRNLESNQESQAAQQYDALNTHSDKFKEFTSNLSSSDQNDNKQVLIDFNIAHGNDEDVIDSYKVALQTGTIGVVNSFAGVLHGIGVDSAGSYVKLFSDTNKGLSAVQSSEGHVNNFGTDVANASPSLIPTFLAGGLGKGAGAITKSLTKSLDKAAKVGGIVGKGSMYTSAFAQSYGGTISGSYEELAAIHGSDKALEMVRENKYQLAAVSSGISTALLVAMNPGGVESYVNGGNRALSFNLKQIRQMAKAKGGTAKILTDKALRKEVGLMLKETVWSGIKDEAKEEGLDQFFQGVIKKLALGGDQTLGELINESLHAAAVGGALGGGMQGYTGNKNDPKVDPIKKRIDEMKQVYYESSISQVSKSDEVANMVADMPELSGFTPEQQESTAGLLPESGLSTTEIDNQKQFLELEKKANDANKAGDVTDARDHLSAMRNLMKDSKKARASLVKNAAQATVEIDTFKATATADLRQAQADHQQSMIDRDPEAGESAVARMDEARIRVKQARRATGLAKIATGKSVVDLTTQELKSVGLKRRFGKTGDDVTIMSDTELEKQGIESPVVDNIDGQLFITDAGSEGMLEVSPASFAMVSKTETQTREGIKAEAAAAAEQEAAPKGEKATEKAAPKQESPAPAPQPTKAPASQTEKVDQIVPKFKEHLASAEGVDTPETRKAFHIAKDSIEGVAGIFDDVQFVDNLPGGGFSLDKGVLFVDVKQIAKNTKGADNASMGKWVQAAVLEEVIHKISTELVSDEKANEIWNSLSPEIQKQAEDSYNWANKQSGAAKTEFNGFNGFHEFIRMVVQQDANVLGYITENAATQLSDGKTLLDTLKELFTSILETLKGIEGTNPMVKEASDSIKAILEQLGQIESNDKGKPNKQDEGGLPGSKEDGNKTPSGNGDESQNGNDDVPDVKSADEAGPVTKKKPAKGKAKQKKARQTSTVDRDRATTPFLNWLRLNPIKASNTDVRKIKSQKAKGEFDSQPRMKDQGTLGKKLLQGIFKKDKNLHEADVVAQRAADDKNLSFSDPSPDALYALIKQEIKAEEDREQSENNSKKPLKGIALKAINAIGLDEGDFRELNPLEQQEALKSGTQKLKFDKANAKGDPGESITTNEDIRLMVSVGDKLIIDGESMNVAEIAADYVTLQDGSKFGMQTVENGETIYVEKFEGDFFVDPKEELPQVPGGANQSQNTSENTETKPEEDLSLESATDQQLKDEAEKQKQKDAIRDGAAKPLEGQLGDTTSDMFAGQDGEAGTDASLFDIPQTKQPEAKPELSEGDQALKDLLGDIGVDGLNAAPIKGDDFAQPIPATSMGAMVNVAQIYAKEGVDTPAAFAEKLEQVGQGKARRFSEALWRGMGMVNPALEPTPNWQEIYGAIDAKGNEDSNKGSDKKPTKTQKDGVIKAIGVLAPMRIAQDRFSKGALKSEADPNELLTKKEFEEAIEASMSSHVHALAKHDNAFDSILEFFEKTPSLTAKTSESKINQAYSTPAPLAYVTSQLADIRGGKIVLETSGGHGILLNETTSDQKVYFNELDKARLQRTPLVINAASEWIKSNEDATEFTPGEKADRVIANPPFGSVMEDDGTYKVFDTPFGPTSSIDHAIVLKSLEAMTDDGRAVFIIGGPARLATSKDGLSKHYGVGSRGRFFKELYENYGVVDHFSVDGDLYKKQGAGWNVDVIVIQGKKPTTATLPKIKNPRMIKSWTDLNETTKQTDEQRIEGITRSIEETQQEISGALDGFSQIEGLQGRDESPIGDPITSNGSVDGTRGGNSTSSSGLEGSKGSPRVDSKPNELPENGEGTSDLSNVSKEPATGSSIDDQIESSNSEADITSEPWAEYVGEKVGDHHRRYKSVAGGFELDTLVPVNQAIPLAKAFHALKEKHGDVSEFVREKLGYSKSDPFGQYLAAEQIDAIALAIDNFENGGALLIGDQTGIGKGRTAAGLMRYAINNGYVPVFVSEKPDLLGVMYEDDVADIGSDGYIKPGFLLSDPKKLDLIKEKGFNAGVDYYNTLSESGDLPDGDNALFTTYDQIATDVDDTVNEKDRAKTIRTGERLAVKSKGRVEAITNLKKPVLYILDESHNAAGDSSIVGNIFTKTLLASEGSKVAYLSATAIKRPEHTGLYFQTTIKNAFADSNSLSNAMKIAGVPGMQIISSMMVEDQQIIRRERSYDGVEFKTVKAESEEGRDAEMSDKLTESLWNIVSLQNVMKDVKASVMNIMREDAKYAPSDVSVKKSKITIGSFGSKVSNITSQFLLSLKAEAAADRAIERILKHDEKVIITVQNTMESAITELVEYGLPLNYNGLVTLYLRKMAEIKIGKDKEGKHITVSALDPVDKEYAGMDIREIQDNLTYTESGIGPDGRPQAVIKIREGAMREMIRRKIRPIYDEIAAKIDKYDLSEFPLSPIDHIRGRVEDAGIRTGEITKRNVGYKNGEVYKRPGKEVTENFKKTTRDAFNDEDLNMLIINESGSTGISLHASEKVKAQNRRHMIVVQPHLDVNKFMQTLGRIHRSGQLKNVLPMFTLLQSMLPIEKRIAAVMAKKLSSLQANTTSNADSEVSENNDDIEVFNVIGDLSFIDALKNAPEIASQIATIANGDVKMILEGEADFKDLDKPPGWFSNSLAGYTSLLTVEAQDLFWGDVMSAYLAKVDYLKQIGEFSLETEEVAIPTKLIESTTFIEGTDGGSVFTSGTDIERVLLESNKKPIDGAEASNKVDNAASKRESELKSFLEGAETLKEKMIAHKRLKSLKWDEKKESSLIAGLRDKRASTSDAISMLGKFGTVKRQDNTTGLGLVTDIILNKDKLLTPSAHIAVIEVNDTRQLIKVPLSQFREAFTPDMAATPKEWDDTISSSEERYMITGNLAQFMAGSYATGRITKFADDNGNDKMGISISKASAESIIDGIKTRQVESSEHAKNIIEEGSSIRSQDGNATLFVVNQGPRKGRIIFKVPASKSKGGKYWRHPVLNKLVEKGTFEQVGANMVADVSKSNLIPFFNVLKSVAGRLETNSKAATTAAGQAERKAKTAKVVSVNDVKPSDNKPSPPTNHTYEVKPFPRTDTGVEVYSVPVSEGRVTPQDFAKIKSVATRNKGRWSRYDSGGAIKGFLFKTESNAKAFADEMNSGNDPDGGGRLNAAPIKQSDLDAFEKKTRKDLSLRDFSVFQRSNGDLALNMIAVDKSEQKQGKGSKAIQRLTDFADKNNRRVVLTTGQTDKGFGTTSSSRLKKFYKRFGFIENKGRNKDFSISENMYREPSSSLHAAPIKSTSGQLSKSAVTVLGESTLNQVQPSIPIEAKKKQIKEAFDSLTNAEEKADDNRGSSGILVRLFPEGIKSQDDLKIKFLGETIADSDELAAKAQVLRNPKFESFYLVAMREGKIVDSYAITTRVPFSVEIAEDGHNSSLSDISDRHLSFLKAAKADSFYYMHNHPSGDVRPSNADRRVTKDLASTLAEKAQANFKGHVIINHNKYTLLDESGLSQFEGREIPGSLPDHVKNESNVTGAFVGSEDDLAFWGRDFNIKKEEDEGRVTVFGVNVRNSVAAVMQYSEQELLDMDMDEFRSKMLDLGVSRVFFHSVMKAKYQSDRAMRFVFSESKQIIKKFQPVDWVIADPHHMLDKASLRAESSSYRPDMASYFGETPKAQRLQAAPIKPGESDKDYWDRVEKENSEELWSLVEEKLPANVEAMIKEAAAEAEGEFTAGDPSLAYGSADAAIRGMDEARAEEHIVQHDIELNAAAKRLIKKDKEGLKTKLFHAALYKNNINAVETRAAALLRYQMAKAAQATGDKDLARQARILTWAYRETGTQAARTLRARRDLFKSPEDRARAFLMEALTGEDPKLLKKFKNDPKIREADAQIDKLKSNLEAALKSATSEKAKANIEKAKANLAKKQLNLLSEIDKKFDKYRTKVETLLGNMGITLDDIQAEKVVIKLKARKYKQITEAKLSEDDAKIIQLIKEGKTPKQTASMLNVKVAAVNKAWDGFRAKLEAELDALGDDAFGPNSDLFGITEAKDLLSAAPVRGEKHTTEERKRMIGLIMDAMGVPADINKMSSGIRKTAKKENNKKKKLDLTPAQLAEIEERFAEFRNRDVDSFEAQQIDLGTEKGGDKDTKERFEKFKETAMDRNDRIQSLVDLGLSQKEAIQYNDEHYEKLYRDVKGSDRGQSWINKFAKVSSETFDINNQDHVNKVLYQMSEAEDADWDDKLIELFIGNILSAPSTAMANMFGMIHGAAEITISRGAQATTNLFLNKEDAATFKEFNYIFGDMKGKIAESYRLAIKSLKFEKSMVEERFLGAPSASGNGNTMFDSIEKGHYGHSIKGSKGRIIRLSAALMTAVDTFFKSLYAQMEVGAYAHRMGRINGLKTGSPEMQEFIDSQVAETGSAAWNVSVEIATKNLFQEQFKTKDQGGGLGDQLMHKVSALVNAKRDTNTGKVTRVIMKMFLPFLKTGYRLMETGIGKTLLGPLSATILGRMVNGGKFSGAEKVKVTTDAIVSILMTSILYGFGEGDDDDDDKFFLITGSPGTDRNKKNQRYRTGLDPFSFRIGGKHGSVWSYKTIEPWATAISTTVDMAREIKAVDKGKNKSEAISEFFDKTLSQIESKTFLKGVGDAIKVGRGDKSREQWAAGQAGSILIPNWIRQTLRNSDPYFRDTWTEKESPEALAYAFLPTPGTNLPARKDVHGNPIKKGGNLATRSLTPFKPKRVPEIHAVDDFSMRYQRQNPDSKLSIGMPSNTFTDRITGKTEKMTAHEYSDFIDIRHDFLEKVLKSRSKFLQKEDISDADFKQIKSIYSKANDVARKKKFNPKYVKERALRESSK